MRVNSTQLRRILVIETAGLGDNIHLLPALRVLRDTWPNAELHVMVNAHVAPLFDMLPWVQRVWSYPSRPKPSFAANWRIGKALSSQRFDLVLNTTGSDRSSLLSWLTRSPRRIGRRPFDGGPPGWRWLFTEVVEIPYMTENMYVQKLRLLQQMGVSVDPLAFDDPDFGIKVDPRFRRDAGVELSDERTYVHLSPFTTSAARELPLRQLAALINSLVLRHPDWRIALSCAPVSRELDGLDELCAYLDRPPWRVWRGSLGIPQLVAVIQGALLNLSGDTGSLHVARMTQTPAVAWFRNHPGEREWIPHSRYGLVVSAPGDDLNALHGIDNAALLSAAEALVRGHM